MVKKQDWIGVACKDYLFVGVRGGFAQLGQGKKIYLQNRNEKDWLSYDSPRTSSNRHQRYQSFTVTDRVKNDAVYQTDLGEGFLSNHPEADFELCEEASILPLTDSFSFIENRECWEYPFRLGHLEISEEDFQLLAEEMRLDVDSIKH